MSLSTGSPVSCGLQKSSVPFLSRANKPPAGNNSYTTALVALMSSLEKHKEFANKFRGATNLATP